MTQRANINYTVTETNGGTITLAVKEDHKYIYIHFDYAGLGSQLADDIQALHKGEHPIEGGWDGNELDNVIDHVINNAIDGYYGKFENKEDVDEDYINDKLNLDFWRDCPNGGQTIIAQDGSIYFNDAGASGKDVLSSIIGYRPAQNGDRYTIAKPWDDDSIIINDGICSYYRWDTEGEALKAAMAINKYFGKYGNLGYLDKHDTMTSAEAEEMRDFGNECELDMVNLYELFHAIDDPIEDEE